jgi:hypothetical protein
LNQAQAWTKRDSAEAKNLWAEALRRAAIEERRHAKSGSNVLNTYQRALQSAGSNDACHTALIDLAGAEPKLLEAWTRSAPPALVDQKLPQVLVRLRGDPLAQLLLDIWGSEGSPKAVSNFLANHPDFSATR